MASINIKYSCGCRFSTDKLEAAVKHSNERHHTLTVLGEIKCEKSPEKAVPTYDFNALRARLNNK